MTLIVCCCWILVVLLLPPVINLWYRYFNCGKSITDRWYRMCLAIFQTVIVVGLYLSCLIVYLAICYTN